ncbi:MAG: helix-turn-helix domain-containing protein [Candidatus Binatia bacterium]
MAKRLLAEALDAGRMPDRARVSIRRAAEKFRRAREDAGLSLRELGEKAGLSPSTILKVERSRVIPSIAVCIRLAGALNRKISWFVEDEESKVDVRLVPSRKGRVARRSGALVRTEVIAEPLRNARMEAFRVTLAPRGGSGRDAPVMYRGEQIVVGVKGRVRFVIRGEEHVVRPGDTLHFKADIPHSWQNPGPGEAQMIMVCAFGYER